MHNAATQSTAAAFWGLIILQILLTVQAYREHKVHNIVLYPDKHSWCKTTTIKQVISYPGCTSIEIDNNVCVGTCFSYSIPHTEPSDPGEVIVPYCDSCQPSETTWHQIKLQCNRNDADTSSELIKHVQIIHNCSCTSCAKENTGISKFPENNDDLFLRQSADPELLDALQLRRNESSKSSSYSNNHNQLDSNDRSKKMYSLLNHKILTLLQNIQLNNSEYDKEQLFDLFYVLQEPMMKHNVKAKNIIGLIKSLQTNKTDMDTTLLTDFLMKLDHLKRFKVETPDGTAKTSDDVDGIKDLSIESSNVSSLEDEVDSGKDEPNHKQHIPIAFWFQNPAPSSDVIIKDENDHHKHTPKKINSHEEEFAAVDSELEDKPKETFALKISSSEENASSNTEDQTQVSESTSMLSLEKQQETPGLIQDSGTAPDIVHQHMHTHLHQHQHHENDNVVASQLHGHLTRGPHGALVIDPSEVHEEKLEVNAHELKPNHAGTLLSYHSHSSEGGNVP